MRAKGLIGWAVLVVGLGVGWKVYKRMPPFERGFHEAMSSEVVEAQGGRGRGDGPRIGNCPVLPADNVWNTPIDTLVKDQRSDAYIESIGPERKVHIDFGSNLNYGIPYGEVPPGTKKVRVAFDYRDESDLGNYPIPPDAPVEGGPGATTGDRHIILIDQRRCILFELYDTHPQPDGSWKAGSGIEIDLMSNGLRAEGKTSADAAGLPIFPGLIRYDEVQAGAINHALRFTIPHTQNAYIWPARHMASRAADIKLAPMGARFRLKADVDISRYSKANQVILTALKRYGMFMADNGGAMFISGVSDKRWDNDDLRKMQALTAGDFEAVDEAGLQMLPDSGRVDPLALKGR